MEDLNTQIKNVLIRSLELEDISAEDIDDDAPLFGPGKGLGLDSIDALELGIAVKDNFGVSFRRLTKKPASTLLRSMHLPPTSGKTKRTDHGQESDFRKD